MQEEVKGTSEVVGPKTGNATIADSVLTEKDKAANINLVVYLKQIKGITTMSHTLLGTIKTLDGSAGQVKDLATVQSKQVGSMQTITESEHLDLAQLGVAICTDLGLGSIAEVGMVAITRALIGKQQASALPAVNLISVEVKSTPEVVGPQASANGLQDDDVIAALTLLNGGSQVDSGLITMSIIKKLLSDIFSIDISNGNNSNN